MVPPRHAAVAMMHPEKTELLVPLLESGELVLEELLGALDGVGLGLDGSREVGDVHGLELLDLGSLVLGAVKK